MSNPNPMCFLDFGGADQPRLHIAHANGYPPDAYRQLATHLTPHYHTISYYSRPFWPDSDPGRLKSWHTLADDLHHFLSATAANRQVIGLGHSMGGIQTMIVAAQQPELFRALILIDPVLFTPLGSLLFGWSKRLRLQDKNPLVGSALRRRREFPDVEAMFQNYRKKRVFARLDSRVLHDYVAGLAKSRGDGTVALAYSPEWEAQLYRTAPHDGWQWPRHIHVPVLIIRGEDSNTFVDSAARRLQRTLKGAVYHTVPDSGHLVPLERPAVVGALILDFLNGL